MQIHEIVKQRGTYAALCVLDPANAMLLQYVADNSIPHKTSSSEKTKHVTLIYSRTYCPQMKADASEKYICKHTGFDIFPTGDGKRALVMLLSAPSVVKRHRLLMSEHPATYDYPQYKPHITLSYDIGDMDVSTLPLFTDDIILGDEYVEDLVLDWQNK